MAKKFLTGIRLLNLIEDPATGVEGEVYFNTTTFAARIYADGEWKYLSESAEELLLQIKNTTGSTINKGTPVYITGSVGGSTVLTVGLADASSASAMPAVGLVVSDLLNDTEGFVQVGGFFRQFTTSPIDGQTPSSNSTVYVKAGGGLTLTKPTGTNLIQNIAKVARVHGSAGSLIVSSIMRTNDIPNIPENKFWLGNSSGVPSAVDFSTEVNRSASATYATQVYAVNAASSASANVNVLALSYASSASANADVRALDYASSASANVNVLALSYASSASANADVRALNYANNTTLGIVSSSVVFEITKPDLTIGDIPEGFIWLDSDDSVTSITSAGVVTLTASEPSSPTHGMVWVDRDANVASMIVDQNVLSSASANADVRALSYASSASANVNVLALSYATSASANVNVLALSYASSASANANTLSQARDNLKADLASPALTGTPTAPTAAAGTNTTQIATTAFSFAAASSASANAAARTPSTDNVERLFLALS